jgi:hypothetical protein
MRPLGVPVGKERGTEGLATCMKQIANSHISDIQSFVINNNTYRCGPVPAQA